MTTDFNRDDFAPESDIKRLGTIKITDVDSNESEIHPIYAASEVLALLDEGNTIETVLSILERGN